MEETIDLRELLATIKKRFWIVILTTVIAVGISVVMTNRTKVQLYQAKTTMIVNIISEPPSAQTAYPAFRKTPAGVHSGEDQPLGVSLAKNSGAN